MTRDQRIRDRLRRHAQLMAELENEGWSRFSASKEAYDRLIAEADADQPPELKPERKTRLTVRP